MGVVKYIAAVLLLWFVSTVQAAEIKSIELPLGLTAQIYVPDSNKAHSQKLFPTLYIMDGQHFIYSAIGYQKSLNWRNQSSPEFIVVAINTDSLGDGVNRQTLLGKDSSKLIDMLKTNLIPFVRKNYPASDVQLYAGWEHAAGFGLDVFSTAPDMFNGYLLASSPVFTDERLQRVKKTIEESTLKLNTQFYLALGEHETYGVDAFRSLQSMLNESTHDINVLFNLSGTISHFTTPVDLFSNGLAWIFKDYPELNFYNLADLKKFGGIQAIQQYYLNRAERYHVSPVVGKNTLFTAARHAVGGDDWTLYSELVNAFGPVDTGVSAGWNHFFGKFHAKNGDYQTAMVLYNKGLQTNPAVHQLWSALAEVQGSLGAVQDALLSYEKALSLVANDSQEYATYKQQMDRLTSASMRNAL